MLNTKSIKKEDEQEAQLAENDEVEQLIDDVCNGMQPRQHDLGKVLKNLKERIEKLESDFWRKG